MPHNSPQQQILCVVCEYLNWKAFFVEVGNGIAAMPIFALSSPKTQGTRIAHTS
jgi:hypothetical protein